MKKLAMVVSVLVGLLLVTGIGKIVRAEPIEHNLDAADVPEKRFNQLATLEILAAIGIVVGLLVPPLGILTGACLLAYFAGAMVAHLRAGDANITPSGAGFVLTVVMLVLQKGRLRSRRYSEGNT